RNLRSDRREIYEAVDVRVKQRNEELDAGINERGAAVVLHRNSECMATELRPVMDDRDVPIGAGLVGLREGPPQANSGDAAADDAHFLGRHNFLPMLVEVGRRSVEY